MSSSLAARREGRGVTPAMLLRGIRLETHGANCKGCSVCHGGATSQEEVGMQEVWCTPIPRMSMSMPTTAVSPSSPPAEGTEEEAEEELEGPHGEAPAEGDTTEGSETSGSSGSTRLFSPKAILGWLRGDDST